MARTAIVFTPKYYDHNTGADHPENPKRLKAILKELRNLKTYSAESKLKFVAPDRARIEDLALVHDPEHIQLVRQICENGGGLLDLGDTVVSPESFEVAGYAVGGAISAVELVLNAEVKNAYALVRPPGHHAGSYYAAGFCVFNNVAIAAAHLIKRGGFKRVVILDIDAHHGNGTQEAFYGSENVLYISLHENPREFPGTGFIDEVGENRGRGYTVNIPFPFGVGDRTYEKAVNDIVIPIIQQFAPQFILASVGYDGYYEDPVGRLRLSTAIYPLIFEKILGLASTLCNDRFAAVLEGGYNLRKLGKLVMSTITKMAHFRYSLDDTVPLERSRIESQAEKLLEKVKTVQSAFWHL